MRRIASVPARINVIGEHTDKFNGLSLPFSCQYRLTLRATSRRSGFSGIPQVVSLWKSAGGWPADLEINSNIPIGAGMSSSAALCVAVVLCIRGDIDRMETSIEAQRIEHEVMQSECGLLDQIAITHSTRRNAVLIDFSNLSMEEHPVPEWWRFKLVDTGIRRNLADTEYSSPKNTLEDRRSHASEESQRVREALVCNAKRLGEILNESHSSLSKTIGCSTPEIDLLVRETQARKGVLGARLMGGGYGGMILALVEDDFALTGEALEVCESATIEELD